MLTVTWYLWQEYDTRHRHQLLLDAWSWKLTVIMIIGTISLSDLIFYFRSTSIYFQRQLLFSKFIQFIFKYVHVMWVVVFPYLILLLLPLEIQVCFIWSLKLFKNKHFLLIIKWSQTVRVFWRLGLREKKRKMNLRRNSIAF